MTQSTDKKEDGEVPQMTFIEVVSSVLAAAFGVQSKSNKERDFRQGKPIHFIIAGIVFVGLFLAGLISIVNLVVSQ